VSDANGVAAAGSWTLGTTSGNQTLTVSASGASPVTFSATANAGPASALAKHAGDNQQFRASNPLPVRPAVKVADQFGNGVAGLTVTFAIEAGGGELTGAVQQTGADGVATVGDWKLGADLGEQRLNAGVQGQAGLAATFIATALENALAPANDTVFSGGALNLTRLTVPAGRTVTVTGDLTITAETTIQVDGTIRGVCRAITLDAGTDLVVAGTVDNSCTTAVAAPPALLLVGRGSYEVMAAGTINTSGDFEITNDPTLTDADFPAALAGSAASGAVFVRSDGKRAAAIDPCTVGGTIQHKPDRARDGNAGSPRGEDGLDARRLWLSCRGNALIQGTTIIGQHGGAGGKGTDNSTTGSNARGGNGGKGGEVRFRSTGSLRFHGSNDIQSGAGGDGGKGESMPPQAPGARAPSANATGGDGSRPGLFQVLAHGPVIFPGIGQGQEDFFINPAGFGGNATAVGADGMNATGTTTAQPGGHADARGGKGGDTPDKRLNGNGIVNPTGLRLSGGDAGFGGIAEATGGKGGDGSASNRNGAGGGNITAHGGPGGDAQLNDQFGVPVGMPGDGGDATFRGGRGGDGVTGCAPPLIAKGGDGGGGGDGIGGAGRGGDQGPAPSAGLRAGARAALTGQDGTTRITQHTGTGGNGKDGWGRGVRGNKGSEALLAGALNRVNEDPVFQFGLNGSGCLFTASFTVRNDPSGVNNVLRVAATDANHLARIIREGSSITVALQLGRTGTVCLVGAEPGSLANVICGGGTASGTTPNGTSFSASGSYSISTPAGSKFGSMSIAGALENDGTFALDILLALGGFLTPAAYDVLVAPFDLP
jgi:hypothetical protein